jgi:hypothetical protein
LALFFVGALSHEKSGVFAGALITSVGIGFLISAGVTYRLSKSWGLIPKKD